MSPVARISAHLMAMRCPSALRDLPGWLIWRYEHAPREAKPRKVPYYAEGGRRHGEQGRPEDRARLTTFQAARAAAARRGFDGVGFAPMPEWGIVALDFDNCVGPAGLDPTVEALVSGTYAEYSPSGRGGRSLMRTTPGDPLFAANSKSAAVPGGWGFEVFASKGFVTITGNVLEICSLAGDEDTIAPVSDAIRALCRARFAREGVDEGDSTPGSQEGSGEPLGLSSARLAEALEVLPRELPYDEWLMVGMALHHETRGEGFELWDEWSRSSPKYSTREYGLARWRSFGKGGGRVVTARSLVRLANAHGARIPLVEASAEDFDDLGGGDGGAGAPAVLPTGYSEAAVADAYVRSLGDGARHVPKQGLWCFWDGRRWVADDVKASLDRVRLFCRGVADQALADVTLATGAKALARTLESTRFAKGVELFAGVDGRVAVTPDAFDSRTWLLNTPAGVVDLRSGRMDRHRPEQMMRLTTSVSPGGARPRFDRFILEVCQGDRELVRYLQVALGYAITGDTSMHSLLFLYGKGRNGKSTLMSLVQSVVGTYARRIPSETLMSDAKGKRHPTEIASLLGTRLAWASEVEEDAMFSDARLKDLTGEDILTGRFMFGDFFEFRRTHNLVLLGNHRPRLKSVDTAIRSRVKMVPFEANFAGREDRSLPGDLAAESGGVLSWLIEGAVAWARTTDLPPCAAVMRASEEYFQAQSTVESWVDECCVREEGATLAAGAAYDTYRAWKLARGEHPTSVVRFSEQMLILFERRIVDGRRLFTDVRLAENANPL